MTVGIVAIGRNEGDRLRRCLQTLDLGVPVVYVDSASTDGSAQLALSMGVDVVELDAAQPLSAARARNAGFTRLTTRQPSLRFVQFIDGDCELAPGWIDAAMRGSSYFGGVLAMSFIFRPAAVFIRCFRCSSWSPSISPRTPAW